MAISTIPSAGVSADTLTAADLAPNSVGSSELANDAVLPANISHLGDGTGTLSGTITTEQLRFGTAFTLTDDVTINGDVTLGKVGDDSTGQSLTQDSSANRTLTGTGTLRMGSSLSSVDGMAPLVSPAFTGSPSITLGSDATGDVYYRAAGGALTRLATGADGTVLTSTGAAAVPAFEALPASGNLFDYDLLITNTSATLNASGTNLGMGGFTGTLNNSTEEHAFRVSFIHGVPFSTDANLDGRNINFAVLSTVTPTVSDGRPAASGGGIINTTLSPHDSEGQSDVAAYFSDVGVSIQTGSTYKDKFWMPTLSFMLHHQVTGTAGVTTYAYYPWWWNGGDANTYLGRAYSAVAGSKSSFEILRFTT